MCAVGPVSDRLEIADASRWRKPEGLSRKGLSLFNFYTQMAKESAKQPSAQDRKLPKSIAPMLRRSRSPKVEAEQCCHLEIQIF